MPANRRARALNARATGSMTPILESFDDFSLVDVWRAASSVPVLVVEEEEEEEEEELDEPVLDDDVDANEEVVTSAKLLEGGVVGMAEEEGVAVDEESNTNVSEETTGTEVGPRMISVVGVGCK